MFWMTDYTNQADWYQEAHISAFIRNIWTVDNATMYTWQILKL